PPEYWAAAASTASKGRWRTSIPEGRRPSITGTARATIPGWGSLVGSLVDLVAFHNLLNFFEAPRTKRGRDQRHGGGTLNTAHFFQADSGPPNRDRWEV